MSEHVRACRERAAHRPERARRSVGLTSARQQLRSRRAHEDRSVGDVTPLDYWTLALAIIGALTGLAALAAQVWSVALSGPRIKVSVANALPTADLRWVLSVDASNVGRLPVTL